MRPPTCLKYFYGIKHSFLTDYVPYIASVFLLFLLLFSILGLEARSPHVLSTISTMASCAQPVFRKKSLWSYIRSDFFSLNNKIWYIK